MRAFDRPGRRVALVICVQAASVAAAGLPMRNMLPYPDAVTYIRLASYYATGEYHLAISGYFGPLFSWLMVPSLLAGVTPVNSARVAVGLSLIVFIAGCARLFQSFELEGAEFIVATGFSATAASAWAFRETSPDLLLSGLICLAIAPMMSATWPTSPRAQFSAGLLWGLAYLAKAVALPLALLVALAMVVRLIVGRASTFRAARAAILTTMLGMLLVAGPWIAVISWKYRVLTFSTSARINHAIVGPPDVDRNHPGVRGFHAPEPGRLTSWEDPSELPYRYWSPFDSLAHAVYQMKLIYWNSSWITTVLRQFDRLGIGVAAAALALVTARPWRWAIGQDQWRWTPVLISILILPYLPVFSYAERYYYAVYPLLAVAATGFVASITSEGAGYSRWHRLAGLLIVFVSFVQDPVAWRASSSAARELPATYAAEAARKLEAAGLWGPVAGAGKDPAWPGGEHTHLYLAYYLNAPDHGAEVAPTADRCTESGAALLVVPRNADVARDLAHDSRFRDLDEILFGSAATSPLPLRIFAVRSRLRQSQHGGTQAASTSRPERVDDARTDL